jgi:Rrf2 family protein
MLVTRETDYAVRCILYLARNNERRTSTAEIAREMHIPRTYLSKILQRLVRGKLVESARGIGGGFRLTKPTSAISLLDIFTIMQGVAPVNICAMDKRRCQFSATCSVHPVWVDIRKDVERRLARETVDRLIKKKT